MRLFLLAVFGVLFMFSGAAAQAQGEQPYPYPYPQPKNPNPYPMPGENPNPYPAPEDQIQDGHKILPQMPVRPGEEESEVPDGPFELCGRQFDSLELAFRTIRRDINLAFTEEDKRYEYYENYEKGLTWVLTKKQFEAHPSLLCKEIITQHGKKMKSITMYCGADGDTCERFQKAINGE